MAEFTVKIAGRAIGMKTLRPETRELFHDYLTTDEPDFTIEATEALIQRERLLMRQADAKNRAQIDGFSDSEIESNYLYREVAERLARYGVVLMHGSAVAVDGNDDSTL